MRSFLLLPNQSDLYSKYEVSRREIAILSRCGGYSIKTVNHETGRQWSHPAVGVALFGLNIFFWPVDLLKTRATMEVHLFFLNTTPHLCGA